MKILYIITSLKSGGAESMLKNIASKLSNENKIMVICLKHGKDYAEILRKKNITVYCLELESSAGLIKCFATLLIKIFEFKPQIVHTWLYHADLIGGLAAYCCRVPIIIWSIRSSNFINSDTSKKVVFIVWLCSRLSWLIPKQIQSCSQSGIIEHKKLGVDLTRFTIDKSIRYRERMALGLPQDCPVILLPARFDPVKNHTDFIMMAKILLSMRSDVFFIMIGEGINNKNIYIDNLLIEHNIKRNFKLLGLQLHPENIMRVADIVVLTSKSEAFPNVLIEAMSCGIKCFSTNVGDALNILGEESIVPIGDMNLMAQYCFDYLSIPISFREKDSINLRRKVENYYDINCIALKYARIYKKLSNHKKVA